MEPTRKLVESAVTGDARSIELLLAQYLPRLRAFVRLRCGPEVRAREASSDIAQSVCRELLEQAGEFSWRGEPAFRSWLFTAAVRKIADRQEHYLAAKRDVRREVAGDAAAEASLSEVYRTLSSPSQHAIAREQAQQIEAAVLALEPEAQEVVVLARIVGLTRAEIAERLGKSETAVGSILNRALARLAMSIPDS